MSDVRAEEVRQWYLSRGISVPNGLSKKYVDGWNKAHPDRPYSKYEHGSYSRYQLGCRCDECVSEASARSLRVYHALKDCVDDAERDQRARPTP